MKIVIEGKPIPKARARIFKKGAHFSAYDPQHEEKNLVSYQMKRQASKEGHKFDTESIYNVSMWFYIPYPSKTKPDEFKEASWGVERIPPQKPDLSNYVKFYEDAANHILWYDDSSIIDIHAYKRYSSNPRTEIEVMQVSSSDVDQTIGLIIKSCSKDEMKDFVDLMRTIVNQYDQSDKTVTTLYPLSVSILRLANEYGEVLKKILLKYKKSNKV